MLIATFNGAMTFQPWILNIRLARLKRLQHLQWSHDLSAMDTLSRLIMFLTEH